MEFYGELFCFAFFDAISMACIQIMLTASITALVWWGMHHEEMEEKEETDEEDTE